MNKIRSWIGIGVWRFLSDRIGLDSDVNLSFGFGV